MVTRILKIVVFTVFYSHCFLLLGQTQQLNLVGEYISDATNNDGTGYQFEMVKAIFEPLGYQVNITVLPYKRALKQVESGQADMMVGMIKDNNMPILFSQSPHEVDRVLAIFINKKNLNWQGLSTFKNKDLVMLPSIAEDAKERLSILSHQVSIVSTPVQALKMLKYGRADFIIMTEGEYILNYKTLDKSEVDLLSQPIGFVEIHAAFTHSMGGGKVKKIWDENFIAYLKSEKSKEMFSRWKVSKNYQTTLNYFNKPAK
jgi:polar amino acid transport system substrate-binding protein